MEAWVVIVRAHRQTMRLIGPFATWDDAHTWREAHMGDYGFPASFEIKEVRRA